MNEVSRIWTVTEETGKNMARLGEECYREVQPGRTMDADYFVRIWRKLIDDQTGALWDSREQDDCHGGLGAIIHNDLVDGLLICVVAFWFVKKEFRQGACALGLLQAAEGWAKKRCARRFTFALPWTNREVNESSLINVGFAPLETYYIKNLWASPQQ